MPCRLATAATGSRSASRMIATICSSENRPFRIAPSESGASLSTYRWSENPGAGHGRLASVENRTAMSGDLLLRSDFFAATLGGLRDGEVVEFLSGFHPGHQPPGPRAAARPGL